ncbi:hypothetical protein NEOLEDRAFT_306694 [Neolentinus lepideus HHB14362 ss-1]|uniref:Uncharacterized protein n=1 Tax=Neolentinus lepideus HHB14362 ss-1 TaxID=1314782 RepID=A0A165VRA0_9AGAM|nr:hypothetical protein NEOLEDRAFT_306694 [Neolentinus lepideus HHB14362 ss-1]
MPYPISKSLHPRAINRRPSLGGLLDALVEDSYISKLHRRHFRATAKSPLPSRRGFRNRRKGIFSPTAAAACTGTVCRCLLNTATQPHICDANCKFVHPQLARYSRRSLRLPSDY